MTYVTIFEIRNILRKTTLINNEGVYRTAPATPGLLKSL